MTTIIPYIISFLIGILLINLLQGTRSKISLLSQFFLGFGLGLGITAHILFINLVIFDKLNKTATFSSMFGLLIILACLFLFKTKKKGLLPGRIQKPSLKFIISLILFFALCVPLWMNSHFYPQGGWDAWSAWNLKARFIFEGGESWKNMLDPRLWRSSPHYPLLLPLINVWGWMFCKEPTFNIPIYTSFLFSVLTAGLIWSGIKEITKRSLSIIPALIIFTIPFVVKLATSQYCDIVAGYYILASLLCIVLAQNKKNHQLTFIAGIFLGQLSFAKPESMLASLIIVALSLPYFLINKKTGTKTKKMISFLLLGCIISYLPTILFKYLYSPGNQTFINGLFSVDKPSTIVRAKFISAFFAVEFLHLKWHSIWGLLLCLLFYNNKRPFKRNLLIAPLIASVFFTYSFITHNPSKQFTLISSIAILILLLLLCLFINRKRIFREEILIFPAFLFFYILIIFAYYFVNTNFEIMWWLQVSLSRILFSLLPAVTLWVCSVLLNKEYQNK